MLRAAPRDLVASFDTRHLVPYGAVRATWLHEAMAPGEEHPAVLRGPVRADVCIVGGGFTGLWTALELKRREPACDVVLIDGDVCGGGASGRNGGFVMTWWSKFASLQKLCGTESALELAARSERAVQEIGAFCETHAIDAQFRPDGWLWTATNREQVEAWAATIAALDEAGAAPYEPLGRDEVAALSGSPVHLAGVFERAVATVQPALLARGMARVAREAGVRIFERSPMTALSGGSTPHVVTPEGSITAGHVVLAINAWAAQVPELARALVVVSSDIIATAPMPERLSRLGWPKGMAISDSRRLINYYRQSEDGRVVFGKGGGALARGGRIGASFARASTRQTEVQAQFAYIYPMLYDADIDATWCGPIDYSISGLPFFCRLAGEPQIVAGAGFSGNGVGPARLGGEFLADLVLNGDAALVPAGLSHPPVSSLPPEPLRYLGGRAVRAAVSRKEATEDRGRAAGRAITALAALDPTSFVDRGQAAPPSLTARL